VVELERIVESDREAVLAEAKALREVLERGGKSAALPTPHMDQLGAAFRELLKQHASKSGTTTPVKGSSPAPKRGWSFGGKKSPSQ
jgi:hypothetical protein